MSRFYLITHFRVAQGKYTFNLHVYMISSHSFIFILYLQSVGILLGSAEGLISETDNSFFKSFSDIMILCWALKSKIAKNKQTWFTEFFFYNFKNWCFYIWEQGPVAPAVHKLKCSLVGTLKADLYFCVQWITLLKR